MNNRRMRLLAAQDKDLPGRKPFEIRLPGFVTDTDVGLGDVIKRSAYRAGIRACGGCDRRADKLNRWVIIKGRK